ncbi:enoyl-CoA hydratase-related protein [Amycolatopsis sp.]|uniref:enoyl-CoA hydratase-related protein n=1 Tax=Amycolatopsis sp. TaxID=37632 RepID=UPI0034592404
MVAVQGHCLAAGLELALLADIVVAGESARFAQVERRIGTTTLLGGAQRLAERAGPARARQIIFDGDNYTAQQFADWNIINHVHSGCVERNQSGPECVSGYCRP